MSLINCPECGREKISDSATQCPGCGFNIQNYIEIQRIQDERKRDEEKERQKNQARIAELQTELETKLRQIEDSPEPQKPFLPSMIITSMKKIWFWAVVIFVPLLLFGLTTDESGYTYLRYVLYSVIICIFYIVFIYARKLKEYNNIISDFPKYIEQQKEQVRQEYKLRIQVFEYDDNYIYYCPICGNRGFPSERRFMNCFIHNVPYIKSKNEFNYYYSVAQERTLEHKYMEYFDVLFEEEIANNSLFDQNEYDKRIKNEKTARVKANVKKHIESTLPKCPICQSTNIKKLSFTNRAIHGAAFGLFSKTARSQWVCKNCGNKW